MVVISVVIASCDCTTTIINMPVITIKLIIQLLMFVFFFYFNQMYLFLKYYNIFYQT